MRPCSLVLASVVAFAAAGQVSAQDIAAAEAGHVECAQAEASCHLEDDDVFLEVSLLQTSLRFQSEEAVMQLLPASPAVVEVPPRVSSAATLSVTAPPAERAGRLGSNKTAVGQLGSNETAEPSKGPPTAALQTASNVSANGTPLAAEPRAKVMLAAEPRTRAGGALLPATMRSDSWIRWRSLTGVSSVVGEAFGSVYDPTRHALDGVPLMLIGMLAFMIGLVFIVQVVGWYAVDGKEGDEYRRPRSSLAARQDLQRASMGAFPVPQSERGSFASASPASMHWERGSLAPGTSGAVGMSPAQSILRSAESVARPDAICPALILPHGEAQFSIPLESISSLIAGHYPVQILGPSGRPLLHARLPTVAQDAAGGPRPGRWLELSTTPRSRYPHACVGPLPMGDHATEAVEIRGPRGDAYGTLEWRGTDWCAKRGGRIVLIVEIVQRGGLSASAPGGGHIAQATPDIDADLVRVQVSPGVDALLTLLCMMAVMLMTPEAAGLTL